MRWLYITVPLMALLAGSIWFAVYSWTELGGEPLPTYALFALGGGIAGSMIVGCGLMALVFYSHRYGYDDAANADQSQKPD